MGPAVFVSNHMRLDDPVAIMWAVHRASGGRVKLWFMMRDDFFRGSRGMMRWLDVDDLALRWGGLPISRDRVQYAQLKQFMKLLLHKEAFGMFNGRSRSRSGLFIEFRDGIEEPGSAAFFLAHAQRRLPGLRVPAIPVARTYNLVTDESVVRFGEPVYLEEGEDRAAQRLCDLKIAVRMGELLEVQVPHVVSGLLYLHCLHRRPARMRISTLGEQVRCVYELLKEEGLCESIVGKGQTEAVDKTIRFLAAHEMLRMVGGDAVLNGERILRMPGLDTGFKKENPVRYLANQILHRTDVTRILCARKLTGG